MPRKLKRRIIKPAELTEDQILEWADAYHKLKGKWPTQLSGRLTYPGAPTERWAALDLALRRGYRGLPGGSSLIHLLSARRGVRNAKALPNLTVKLILKWCDDFHQRTGSWPRRDTAPGQAIPGSSGENWNALDSALRSGCRGLPVGSSLTRLLAKHRRIRNPAAPPRLTLKQILIWADVHYERTGNWPSSKDSAIEIPSSNGETWCSVAQALATGTRGLSKGFTLPQLLAERRGVRNQARLPRLTVNQILAWADAFRAETGKWPVQTSPQVIDEMVDEQWVNVDHALRDGLRGLPGASSLRQLLCEHRGIRNHLRLPRLTTRKILKWADAFHGRSGTWPSRTCSPQVVEGTDGERWAILDGALQKGRRGLPGGSSLARLLAEHRGVRNLSALPRLTIEQILAWADAFHRLTGEWPTARGPRQVIPGSDGERWSGVDHALHQGGRGLQRGSSIARLLARYRGVPNRPTAVRVRMAAAAGK